MTSAPGPEDEPRVVIRDKRRVDPSGAIREPDPGPEPASSQNTGEAAAPAPDARVAELTDTLQRLKAEYDNYRRRTERDRQSLAEVAAAGLLVQLLPVLDDIERARSHGDLTGAFGAVGDALVGVTTRLGLEAFGAAGEPFDPVVHEAVLAAPEADVEVAIAAEVFRPGYRFAGRVLRPAQVSVAQPATAVEPASAVEPGGGPSG